MDAAMTDLPEPVAELATILAAQSAVGWEHRGVVTSASQFSRNIGGTVGVSIAGALFSAGVGTALAAGFNPNDLLSSTVRAGLSVSELGFLQSVLAAALRNVYVLFVGVGLAATVIGLWLPGGPPRQASDAGAVFRVEDQRYLLIVLRAAAHTANKTSSGDVLPPCALPQHNGRGPGHIAFGVSPDALDSWRARLVKYDVDVLSDITWKDGARSLYFRDPDGHMIELATAGIWESI